MDLSGVAAELAEDFTEVRLEHAGGKLILPVAPIDLGFVASDHLPDHVDDDNAYEVVRSAAGMEPLIMFEWDEDGSETWHLSIDVLRIGDRAYITLPPDDAIDQPWEAFAAVDHPDTIDILDALLFDLLWDNGESYGIELVSSLPTGISSASLNKETVRAALHLYLEWDDARNEGAWRDAAEHLPGHMRANDRLANAAANLVADDTDRHRDEFIEAYVEVAYKS